MTTIKPRARLAELDALRGIGALLVVNFHYSTRFPEIFPRAHHVPFHLFGGNYRVLLFFAISGFAIFFSMARLRSAADFIVGRAARLLPAYWAAMALTLLIEYFGHATALMIPPFATLVNLSMLEGFFFLPSVDGAYWTLTVEVAFYACMLGAWLAFRLKHVERLILVWLLARLVLTFLWVDMPERLVMLLVLRWMPFFAIGMVAYRVWSGQRSWRQQLPVILAILATLALTAGRDYVAAGGLLVLLFAAAIGGHLRWLCVAPLIWVGQISYALYLVHQHIGFTIMLNADAAGWHPVAGYGAAVAAAFLLGWLVNRYVERPAAQAILGWWRGRALRGEEATAATVPVEPAAMAPPVLQPLPVALSAPVDRRPDSL